MFPCYFPDFHGIKKKRVRIEDGSTIYLLGGVLKFDGILDEYLVKLQKNKIQYYILSV